MRTHSVAIVQPAFLGPSVALISLTFLLVSSGLAALIGAVLVAAIAAAADEEGRTAACAQQTQQNG
jgi:hypothetical protein